MVHNASRIHLHHCSQVGANNKATDALSRRINLMSTMKNVVLRFKELLQELREDSRFGPIIERVDSKTRHDYFLQDDYLFFGNLLYIPNTSL
jgi:hypothetical protein